MDKITFLWPYFSLKAIIGDKGVNSSPGGRHVLEYRLAVIFRTLFLKTYHAIHFYKDTISIT